MSHDIVALLEAGHCTDYNGRIAAKEIKRLRELLRVAHPHVDDKALWEAIRAALGEGNRDLTDVEMERSDAMMGREDKREHIRALCAETLERDALAAQWRKT
jgi:hypothetical protein